MIQVFFELSIFMIWLVYRDPIKTWLRSPPDRWLRLIRQLAAKPAYVRTTIRRRPLGFGTVAVRNALPLAGERADRGGF